MITETHIQLINDRYKYNEVNGGLINIATGAQNKGTSAGGRYKQIKVSDMYIKLYGWCIITGKNHINGNSLDNRDVSHTENMINRSNASEHGKWVRATGSNFRVEFVFKGVEQFYSFPTLWNLEIKFL